MKKLYFIILLNFCFVIHSNAEDEPKIVRYKTSLIFSTGANKYNGDVCNSCSNFGFQGSLSSRFLIQKKWFFRPELSLQRIQSNVDEKSLIQFKNNNTSLALNLEYNLTGDKTHSDKRSKNEFFLAIAPSITHHNPFTIINGNKTFLAPLSTENKSYSKLLPGAKIGIFGDISLTKLKRIGINIDYNLIFSDYIDDTSGKYIDYLKTENTRSLAIDPSQKADIGSNRGNSSKFDSYIRVSLSYEFNFERKQKIYN